uniref:Im:7138239 n=1 Tax=Cyprinus carpio TaxID=7962 RepID=A0A8C1U2L4_CYPCA
MDLLPLLVFLLLCAVHQTFTAVLGKNTESRNLFTERACCRRQSHIIYIGKDISGSPVNVDVGVCRTHCGQSAPSASLEAGLMTSKYSSVLDFLRHKKTRHLHPSSSSGAAAPGSPSCGLSSTCEPAGVRVDRVMLYEGLREVEIIEDCHCETKMSRCVRAPSLKTYFSETPYESVIDAGKCVGSKGAPEGFSCVPTKFDSTFIETPNKVELIQTVAQCKLMEGCYRIPYVEYHYEITYNDDGVKVESLREIDVGRCLGSCTSGSRCLLRSASDLGECLLWAEGQGNACVPQDYESHTFLSQQGQIRTVLAITSCLCQS